MERGPKFSEAILTFNLLCVIRPGKRNNRQSVKKQAIQEVAAEPLGGRHHRQAQAFLLPDRKSSWPMGKQLGFWPHQGVHFIISPASSSCLSLWKLRNLPES